MIAYRHCSGSSDTIVFESDEALIVVGVVHRSLKQFYAMGFRRMVIFAHPKLIPAIRHLAPHDRFVDDYKEKRFDSNLACHIPAPWFIPNAVRIEVRHYPQ